MTTKYESKFRSLRAQHEANLIQSEEAGRTAGEDHFRHFATEDEIRVLSGFWEPSVPDTAEEYVGRNHKALLLQYNFGEVSEHSWDIDAFWVGFLRGYLMAWDAHCSSQKSEETGPNSNESA